MKYKIALISLFVNIFFLTKLPLEENDGWYKFGMLVGIILVWSIEFVLSQFKPNKT